MPFVLCCQTGLTLPDLYQNNKWYNIIADLGGINNVYIPTIATQDIFETQCFNVWYRNKIAIEYANISK